MRHNCTRCGGALEEIPCPDGRPGCEVFHLSICECLPVIAKHPPEAVRETCRWYRKEIEEAIERVAGFKKRFDIYRDTYCAHKTLRKADEWGHMVCADCEMLVSDHE